MINLLFITSLRRDLKIIMMLLLIILLVWVIISAFAKDNSVLKNKYISTFLIVFMTMLLIMAIEGDGSLGTDMPRYLRAISTMEHMTFTEASLYFRFEPLFLFLQWTYSQISTNPDIYVRYLTLLFIVILFSVSRNLFYNSSNIFFIFSYLSYPIFYDYLYNGTRQGFSMIFLVLAISLWLNSSKPLKQQKIFVSLLFAAFFHYSSIPIIILYLIVVNTDISLRHYIIAWIGFMLLFITNINTIVLNIPIIRNIEFVENYSSNELIVSFGEVNKINFLLFSLFFLLIALFLNAKSVLNSKVKENYIYIIKFYIAFNIFYLLFGFVAYSNRVSAYSWYLIPLLVMYPIIHDQKQSPMKLGVVTVIFCCVGFLTSSYQYFL